MTRNDSDANLKSSISTVPPSLLVRSGPLKVGFDSRLYRPATKAGARRDCSSLATLRGALWRRSMEASTARLRSIILPINVQSYHWYIAILDVGPTQCCMEICTDVNIRNPAAEQTLTEIGNKYLSTAALPGSPGTATHENAY